MYNPNEKYLNNLTGDIQFQINSIYSTIAATSGQGGTGGSGLYVPISGGTMTGPLNVNNVITANSMVISGNLNVISGGINLNGNSIGTNSNGNKYIQVGSFSDPGGNNGDIVYVI